MIKGLLLLSVVSVVFASGCTQAGVDSFVSSLPQVQEFLRDNPGSTIVTNLLREDAVQEQISGIRESCGPEFPVKAYYRVSMTSPEIESTIWMDAATYEVECSVTRSLGEAGESPGLEESEEEVAKASCATNSDCSEEEMCLDGSCLELDCEEGFKASGHECVSKGLSENFYGDDPVKGSPESPVTMVEFSDFQCPFCGRFFSDTLPQIESNYIDKGLVRAVFRDFPLGFHENAQPAAEAAECADEQGMFWEFHDLAFGNQTSLGRSSYLSWASELGLDTGEFGKCIDARETREEVEKDLEEGAALGVSGTPTFFFVNQEGGIVKVVGAQPYQTFQNAIEELL